MACVNVNSQEPQVRKGRQTLCESGCPSNSSKSHLTRRKNNSIMNKELRKVYAPRATGGSNVKERVLSAKLLKLRTLQNQLNDTNFRLIEVAQENKMLKTLQKRQDRALVKYEASNADLPRLITSHQEEMRFLQTKNKTLRKTIQDLTEQVKSKDEELNVLKSQYKHLVALSKDKHLAEREKLTEKVQELTEKLTATEATVSNLNRKLIIETKNAKHKLNAEIIKNKQNQKEMCAAVAEINRLSNLVEHKDKTAGRLSCGISSFCGNSKRFSGSSQRQTKSLVSLSAGTDGSKETCNNLEEVDKLSTSSQIQDPIVEDLGTLDTPDNFNKLEPSTSDSVDSKEEQQSTPKSASRSNQRSPYDSNFRVRLSAKSHRSSADSLEVDFPLKADESLSDSGIFIGAPVLPLISDRPDSTSRKIEKLSRTLESVKMSDGEIGRESALGEYCSGLVSTAQYCNEVVNTHTENLKHVQEDTEKILENVQQVDAMNKKLKKSKFPKINMDELDRIAHMTPDVEKINKNDLNFITTEEKTPALVTGRGKSGSMLLRDIAKTVESDPVVTKEHKQKLLEALRAIDNGENVDMLQTASPQYSARRKNKLMNDLFGDVNKKLTGDL